MINWKTFVVDEITEQGLYLVTDGRSIDIANFDDCGGDEAEWFLPNSTGIDGINSVTHYTKLHLPYSSNNESVIANENTFHFTIFFNDTTRFADGDDILDHLRDLGVQHAYDPPRNRDHLHYHFTTKSRKGIFR